MSPVSFDVTGSQHEGAGAVHLGVYPDNAAALALYRSACFRKVPHDFYTHRFGNAS